MPVEKTLTREGIKQDVAKIVSVFRWSAPVSIVGTSETIAVKAHTEDKLVFLEALLRPSLALADSFALKLFCKHKTEWLMEEQDINLAGEQAKIKSDDLFRQSSEVTGDKDDLIKRCKIARAKFVQFAFPGDDEWDYDPATLLKLLSYDYSSLRTSDKGVVGLTVAGAAGDYTFYLRGVGSAAAVAKHRAATYEADEMALLLGQEKHFLALLEGIRAKLEKKKEPALQPA